MDYRKYKKYLMARRPRFELGKGITPNGISSPAPYQAGPPPHLNASMHYSKNILLLYKLFDQ